MNAYRFTRFLTLLLLFLFALVTLEAAAYAQERRGESVVLVPLTFADDQWSAGEVQILPCAAPSKFLRGTETDPLVRLLGQEQVIAQRHIRNPRFILVEDPKEEPPLLSKVSFVFRFPLIKGAEIFEFWYDPQGQKAPSVVVDLREAIKTYWDKGGPKQKASCQQEYVPDQLKR
ncbi:MAG: hypothetical protein D6736_04815 [Nitrospinota bacterium]|nr:MAG: hypothetical protein D6736_04815 [Nitrospinota bacterium]